MRRRAWLALVVVAVAGCGGGQGDAAIGVRAAEATQAAGSYRLLLDGRVSERTAHGDVTTSSGEGIVDVEHERSRFTLEQQGDGPSHSERIQIGDDSWTKSAAPNPLPGGAVVPEPFGDQWVHVHRSRRRPTIFDLFDLGTFVHRLRENEFRLLPDGPEEVRGVVTTRYEVEHPEAGEHDRLWIWIDADDLVRRIRFSVRIPADDDIPAFDLEQSLTFYDFGVAVPPIEAPPAAEVRDLGQ